MQISEVLRVFCYFRGRQARKSEKIEKWEKLHLQTSPATRTPAMTVFARSLRALCSERRWVPVRVPLQHPGRDTSCAHLQPRPDTAKLSKQTRERSTHSLQIRTPSAPGPKQGLEIPPELAGSSSRWVFTSPGGKITSRRASLTACKYTPDDAGTDEMGQR